MSRLLALLLFIFLLPVPARPYSVQTHEQIIDLVWLGSIQPLLLSRYPGLTPALLREAHAYAYGGSAIQDLGYYPFGNEFFSDLTHYVRPGDFVVSLLRNAQNANELAFAIGALSHYLGDTIGHSTAVNPSVAIEFPKLARRYGNSVTYEQSERAHVRTEFAFDINEIAKHRFAPLHYLRHVGLGVPTHLLSVAFYETYGLDEVKILGHHKPVLRGYKFAVRNFLPRIAYAENRPPPPFNAPRHPRSRTRQTCHRPHQGLHREQLGALPQKGRHRHLLPRRPHLHPPQDRRPLQPFHQRPCPLHRRPLRHQRQPYRHSTPRRPRQPQPHGQPPPQPRPRHGQPRPPRRLPPRRSDLRQTPCRNHRQPHPAHPPHPQARPHRLLRRPQRPHLHPQTPPTSGAKVQTNLATIATMPTSTMPPPLEETEELTPP